MKSFFSFVVDKMAGIYFVTQGFIVWSYGTFLCAYLWSNHLGGI